MSISRSLGIPLVVVDAVRPLPFVGTPFDKILIDAPCSGTGTLGRNPEIKWRLKPEDLDNLAGRQGSILEHSLRLLGPGGRAVYATCSLEPQENAAVVNRVLGLMGDSFRIVESLQRIPGRDEGDGFFAFVIERAS